MSEFVFQVEHTESVLKDVDEKQMLNGNSTSTSPR